jgi:hypothetical protein
VFGQLVAVQQSGRVAGHSEVEMVFTDVRIDGQMVPIQTSSVQAASGSTTGRTARNVGAGAIIGGAFGGSSGAARGAAVGGAASLLTRGQQVHVPAGTLLQVQLRAPVVMAAPQSPPTNDTSQQDCIRRLIDNGFSADDAIRTCGG